jgi:hypothetical protein
MYLASKSQNCPYISLVRLCLLLRLCFSRISGSSLAMHDDDAKLATERRSPLATTAPDFATEEEAAGFAIPAPSAGLGPAATSVRSGRGHAWQGIAGRGCYLRCWCYYTCYVVRVQVSYSLLSCSNLLTNKCSINKIAKELLTILENTRSRVEGKNKTSCKHRCCVSVILLPSFPCRPCSFVSDYTRNRSV